MDGLKTYIKNLSVFSLGVFAGTCYGAIVGTLTTFFLLTHM